MDRDTNFPPLSASRMATFNSAMAKLSERRLQVWSSSIVDAGDDEKKLRTALDPVVLYLSLAVRLHLQSVFRVDDKIFIDIAWSLDGDGLKELKRIVLKSIKSKDWVGLLMHLKNWNKLEYLPLRAQEWEARNLIHNNQRLSSAYNKDFIGETAEYFIDRLKKAESDARLSYLAPLYAKTISVVQSSGTGKSRLMTEVGKQIFTLPICLRKSNDPGYPPGDEPVVNYFSKLSGLASDNDLSNTAHVGMACFDFAAKSVMLEWLQALNADGNGPKLLEYWHGIMEPKGGERNMRQAFFEEVVRRANSKRGGVRNYGASPRRGVSSSHPDTFEQSLQFYNDIAKKANEDLSKFLSEILPTQSISVMYFDEAHELGLLLWVFLRLMQHQVQSTNFCQMASLRFRSEVARLEPPYLNLGFDQQAIKNARETVSVRMDKMQTTNFLAQFGRPIWKAHIPEERENELIELASWMLLNGKLFDPKDKDHVFAVLSQRLCLEPALANPEAEELAKRSVCRHMRLLTDFPISSAGMFHTYSPSEPILVLGSFDILYNISETNLLPRVLDSLSRDLCSEGLVEKGVLGELGARILLLTARDFTAPSNSQRRDLLKPVPLLGFLYRLFHRKNFTDSETRDKIENGFREAYINFTHFILTEDPVPDPSNPPNFMLLANLWARGGALQCCFRQESIDLLIPIYVGSVSGSSPFDPSKLSAVVVQVMNQDSGDTKAELALRPIGIPRDPQEPLPCLALLMELGTKSRYGKSRSCMQCEASDIPTPGEYERRCVELEKAKYNLNVHLSIGNPRAQDKEYLEKLEELKKMVEDSRIARDSYNRFSISARGISPDVYRILHEAEIEREFEILMARTGVSPPEEENNKMGHMRPLERLGSGSNRTDWMAEYVLMEPMDVDDFA